MEIGVSTDGCIFWNWIFTWPPGYIFLSLHCVLNSAISDKGKVDITERVWSSIRSHEIKECNWTGDTSLCNKGLFLTGLENSTGIDFIDHDLDLSIFNFINNSCTMVVQEVRFDWVASVFTPHALKVHSTDWTIIKEHSVKLIVVELHDLGIVLVTAKVGLNINEWTCLCHGVNSNWVLYPAWCISSLNENWHCNLRSILTSNIVPNDW